MFNNGAGHHIHGGIFYNVGGDVKLQNYLQTHHNLTLENRRMAPRPLPGSSSGHEDVQRTTPQQRTIHSHELHDLEHNVGAAGWERGREGVVRSACHSAALRPGLYGPGDQ
ncbi:hypothetical protein C8J57DRAFT_1460311 [Mycena rebaudengoi]|nr:hypothetical protein C8J57DRAFT_1460311 [Mycena rebaudengoi]